jgi:chemotaxis protein histidine kinase CheA
MVFEVNSHLLVERYQISFEDNQEKHLELFWNPVTDENDRIRRFVINIRDITELVALQEKTLQQQKEFKIIAQVFSISHDNFESFINSSREYVQSCLELLKKVGHFDLNTIAHVFRNLHTIKGNSRLYGFDDLTNVVHDVEEEVNRVRSREIPYHNQRLIKEIQKVGDILDEYSSVIKTKLQGFLAKKQKGVFLDDQLFTALKDTIMNQTCEELSGSIQTIVQSQKILAAYHTVSLAAVFDEINASVKSMAEIVGKPKPNLHVSNNKIRVSRETASILNVVIMHSIRNSLSHGIEDQNTRQSLGKHITGNIYLVAGLTDERFTIEYWDDGAGLNLKKIMTKAYESGLVKLDKPLGAKQVACFIFCPGLSTAEKVTEIAGRGVGMDAILKAIKSIGGSIDILFQDKAAVDPALKPFKFVIVLPVTLAQTLD